VLIPGGKAMQRELVLLGGGHAHLSTLAAIASFRERGFAVTVVQPSPWLYYSGMGPGMLGGSYRPEEIRFATRSVVEGQGGRFVLDRAERIDPVARTVSLAGSAEELRYDVLSCSVGSEVRGGVSAEGVGETVFPAKPIEGLLAAKERVLALAAAGPCRLAVVGGGPSAVEIAGNLHQLCRRFGRNRPEILLYAGRRLLSRQPERLAFLARKALLDKGIRIVEGPYVVRLVSGRLFLDDGSDSQAAMIFDATGVLPGKIFHRSGLPVGPDGGLLVNAFLQSVRYPEIFGGGDCISFEPRPLARVGVYAVRQNLVLRDNLFAALQGGPLTPFSPQEGYLQIFNLGDGVGLFSRRWCIFAGRFAFLLKDWIDRRFMRTYQRAGGTGAVMENR
jgi:NADH dehydrogenase FAD-containing subunit